MTAARWVSRVTLTFDGKNPVTYDLNASSHVTAGQTLTFPSQTFHTLRVTIDATTNDTAPPASASAVGFSEIEIPGQQVHQVVQMPSQMLTSLGTASAADRVTVVMTRQRTSQFPPRDDPETTITRQFSLPTARTFTLAGSASLSALIPDDEVDRLVGRAADRPSSVKDAYSSGRLPGDVKATASATVDGDPTTAWQPGLGNKAQIGSTLTYDLATPQTLTGLNMQVIADGRHSVPTTMTIASGNQVRTITVPPIADGTVPDAVTTVPVTFPALTGSHFVVTFTGIRPEYAANYYSAGPLALPLGIAEIGIPGARANPIPAALPGNCVSNLLTIDGQPIDVSVVGPTPRALNGGESQVVPCGPDANGITLSAGPHIVQTAAGHNAPCANAPTTCTGWNIDQLALDSASGGGAGSAAFPTASGTPQLEATQPGPAATVQATSVHIDSHGARVTGATEPFELVLGQSVNKGWKAVATPGPGAAPGAHAVDLGRIAARGRVRQRLAGHRGRPARARRLHLHGAAHLDPAEGGLGGPGRLRSHHAPLPRPRLPAAPPPGAGCGPTSPVACAARPGPEPPERPAVPFDAARLTLPGSPPPKEQRQRGWLRFPRALIIGVIAGAAALLVTPPVMGLVVAVAGHPRPPGALGPRHRRRGRRSPASWPEPSTWCRARTSTTSCPAPTGPPRSSTPAT